MNWVGVEWDDHTRGKHDGWLEGPGGGERYFSCEMGAGSFVKAQKLQLSRDFVEVMRERYDHGGEEESVINSVGTLRGKSKPIILVGMDKVAVSFYLSRLLCCCCCCCCCCLHLLIKPLCIFDTH